MAKKETSSNNKKKVKREMTLKEIQELDALYQYIKINIMGYDENQALDKKMVLRLKGIRQGLIMANNDMEDKANYTFSLILNTFKYCSPQISYALKNKTFKSEMNKFNYVLAIVESRLNEVYKKMKAAERIRKTKEEVIEKSVSEEEYVHVFKAPEQKKISEELSALI